MLSENGDVIKVDTTGARPLDPEYPKWRTDATMWLQFCANFAGRYIEMRMRAPSFFEHAHRGYKSVFKTDTAL